MSLLDVDHWREIWNALRGNKIRTLLTAFGVFWGIFLLMVMMPALRPTAMLSKLPVLMISAVLYATPNSGRR